MEGETYASLSKFPNGNKQHTLIPHLPDPPTKLNPSPSPSSFPLHSTPPNGQTNLHDLRLHSLAEEGDEEGPGYRV